MNGGTRAPYMHSVCLERGAILPDSSYGADPAPYGFRRYCSVL